MISMQCPVLPGKTTILEKFQLFMHIISKLAYDFLILVMIEFHFNFKILILWGANSNIRLKSLFPKFLPGTYRKNHQKRKRKMLISLILLWNDIPNDS